MSAGLLLAMPWRRPVAGPPPVSDIDLTSLVHRWRPSRAEGCWSDNGVTPAVAGGLLYRVDDEIGTDHLLQATALERPTWASNATPSKHPGIAFALGKSLLTAGNITTTDTTYYWVGAFSRIADSVAFARTTGGVATEYLYYATASNGAAADTVTVTRGTSRAIAPSAGALPTDRLAVVALVVDAGTNTKLYVDGVLVGTSAVTPGSSALASRLGLNIWAPGFSTYTGTSTTVELAMYSVAHDATAVAANSTILLTKYSTLAAVPSDLASLLLDLRLGAADLYTDAARTTAAVSGDPVGGWKDTAAAAHHLDQSTSARRPIYYSSGLGGGARPRVSFDGVDDGLLMSGWSLGSGAQTIAMEFVRRTNPTAQRLFSVRQAGPIFSAISLINYAGYAEITCYLGGAGGNSIGCNPVLGTGRHTLVVCYDGSGSSTPANYAIFVDGTAQTVVSGNSFLDAVAMGALGSYNDATIPSAVDIGRVAAWSGDHRASRLAIEGWLNG